MGLKSEYHGHLAPYAQFLMIGNEGEEGERRLIDLHGFAAGKNKGRSYSGYFTVSLSNHIGCATDLPHHCGVLLRVGRS